MPLHIRTAETADSLGIATVHVRSWQAAYDGLLPDDYLAGLSIDERAATWKLRMEDELERGTTLVADLAGEVVGFASVGPSRDADADELTGEVRAIYVRPDRWRQGIGTALFASALESLAVMGFRSVTLWVLSTNRASRAFYERHGCRPDGRDKLDDRGGVQLAETRYRLRPPDPDEPRH